MTRADEILTEVGVNVNELYDSLDDDKEQILKDKYGFELLESDRSGDDDHDLYIVVFKLEGHYWSTSTYYSSWEGIGNDWCDIFEVEPVQVTKTEYHPIKKGKKDAGK